MTVLSIPARFAGTQYREGTIEHLDPEEGTIVMRAAPYGVETQLDLKLWEAFDAKCFERAANAPHRCKVWHEHQGPLIGHASTVEDRPDGIWISAKLSNTLAGQEARELARDGTLDQVSVTFKPMSDWMKAERRPDGIHVRHARAHLLGVALVAHGAYADNAFIASVREAEKIREAELEVARLRTLTH